MSASSQPSCGKQVADHTGFHFYPCGRLAKHRVHYAGREYLCCGIHVKQFKNRYGAEIMALSQQDAAK